LFHWNHGELSQQPVVETMVHEFAWRVPRSCRQIAIADAFAKQLRVCRREGLAMPRIRQDLAFLDANYHLVGKQMVINYKDKANSNTTAAA
jgi:hypothetical protein